MVATIVSGIETNDSPLLAEEQEDVRKPALVSFAFAGGQDDPSLTIEEFSAITEDDIRDVKKLFEESFPIRYGDYFYDSLRKGTYGGRPLLTCIARRNGALIGAACSTREDEGSGDSNVVASGKRTYLMTLAVVPK